MQTEAAQYNHGQHPSVSWSPNHDSRMYTREPFKSPPPAHDGPGLLSRRDSWQSQSQYPASPPLSTNDNITGSAPRYNSIDGSRAPSTFLASPTEERPNPHGNGFTGPETLGSNTSTTPGANNTSASANGNGNSTTNGKAKFVCTKKVGCNKTFAFKSLQEKHEATHLKPYVCEYCKNVRKSFASKTDLQRHTNNVHFSSPSSAFSYRCKYDACANRQRIILRLDNFKTHLKRKHKKPEEPDSDDFYSRAEKECRIYREPTAAPVDIPHEQHRQEISKAHEFTCEVPSCSANNVGFATDDELRRHRRLEHELDSSPVPESGAAETSAVNNVRLTRSTVPGKIQLPTPPTNGENWQAGGYHFSPTSAGSEPVVVGQHAQTHSRQEVAAILAEMRDPNRHDNASRDYNSDESNSGQPTRRSTLPVISGGSKRQVDDSAEPKAPKRAKTIPVPGKSDHPRPRRIECEVCGASFHQYRDLKKHRIRHDRPFFCTYDGCDGTFGSKNDWVRHEKSQHFKLESWKCPLNNSENPEAKQYFGVRCRTRFFRREGLREHIRRWHSNHLPALFKLVEEAGQPDGANAAKAAPPAESTDTDLMLKAIVDKSFTSRSPHDTFWCGFCRKTRNVGKGPGALDRYEHIGSHFDAMIKGGPKEGWHRMEAQLLGMNTGASDVFLTEPAVQLAVKQHFDQLTTN